jgi:hypothetical protein
MILFIFPVHLNATGLLGSRNFYVADQVATWVGQHSVYVANQEHVFVVDQVEQPELIMSILFLLLIKMHHLLSGATSWVTGFRVFGWCMFLCRSGQSSLLNWGSIPPQATCKFQVKFAISNPYTYLNFILNLKSDKCITGNESMNENFQ